MKKMLMYASVASMIHQFNMENIQLLLKLGYQVDVACNMEQGSSSSPERIAKMKAELEDMGCRVFHVPVPRKITALGAMWKSFRQTKTLMNEQGYDLVHCHTPIGSVICRLANRCGKHYGRTKMIYTAHGFHFFKGAPLKNWLLYYPVEKLCARFTDVLITINQEDYDLARRKMKAGRVEYVPGVGVDLEKFKQTQEPRIFKRKELGIGEEEIVLMSVGELNQNKNHETVIRAMKNQDVYYMIAGIGGLREYLQTVADELGLQERVKFLGYRTDIAELYNAADVCVFPSIREGLGLAAIEGMACGLPLIVSDNRGSRVFCIDGENGFVCAHDSVESFAKAIEIIKGKPELRERFGKANREKAQQFGVQRINEKMLKIYKMCGEEKIEE